MNLNINPLKTLWTNPIGAIKSALNYSLIPFYLLFGLACTSPCALFLSMKFSYSLSFAFSSSLILALPLGYLLINAGSFITDLLGSLFKAKGSFEEIRRAFCLTSIPNVLASFLAILFMTVYSTHIASSECTTVFSLSCLINTFVVLGLIQPLLSIYSFILCLYSMKEIQKLSIPKTLITLLFQPLLFPVLYLTFFSKIQLYV